MKTTTASRHKFDLMLAATVVVCAMSLNAHGAAGHQEPFRQTASPTKSGGEVTKQISSTSGVPDADKKAIDAAKQNASDSGADAEQCEGIKKLTAQVERLSKKVQAIEKDQLFQFARVLLTGEEQRAESLVARIRETFEKATPLQIRLAQIDEQLKPENIERAFIGIGSLRPEESRDGLRKKFTVERQSIIAVLEALRQERARLQLSILTSEMAIQRLRARLTEAGR